jgi:uncharacterized protein (DUF488 family)
MIGITPNPVFTIGHSTHALPYFTSLLRKHGITALADVRSAPYSRFNPQFNRETLAKALGAERIRYVFLGEELGARSKDPSCYDSGRVQYQRLASTDAFKEGLGRVIRGAGEYKIALMCAEKDPLECHRTLLVARALVERGVSVHHILSDGRAEPHEFTMHRLLEVVDLPRQDLFRSKEELLREAMARQEERIAYVDERMAEGDGAPA